MTAPSPPVALAVAGSDSGGGAGIQADLKAFAACGVHGTTAITAITAQNTVGVEAAGVIAPELIVAQVHAVVADIGVDAVKVGMLGDETTIATVAEALAAVGDVPVVVDPVMVSESGATLLDPGARTALVERILPLASVVTPNLPEARTLVATAGIHGDPEQLGPVELATAILELGPAAVIVTGGHTEDGADTLATPGSIERIAGERHPDGAAHGSGCTHSSALAAFLAHGFELAEAALAARAVAGLAIRDGLRGIGAGTGPVDAAGVAARAAEVQAGAYPPAGLARRAEPLPT